MQRDLETLEHELKDAVEEIWAKKLEGEDGEAQAPLPDSWATRMEEIEKNRRINPVDRVPKPDLTASNQEWKMKLLEAQ